MNNKFRDLLLRHMFAYTIILVLLYAWLKSVVTLPNLMLTVLKIDPANPWPYCITIILLGGATSLASYFIIAKAIQHVNTSHRYYDQENV